MNSKKIIIRLFLVLFSVAAIALISIMAQRNTNNSEKTIRDFFESIRNNRLVEASGFLLTGDFQIKKPGNALGNAIRSNIQILKIEPIASLDNSGYTADVTLEVLDVRQIMSRATLQLLLLRQGNMAQENFDEDEALSEIYGAILEAGTLPKKQTGCILTLKKENGRLKLVPDESLQKILDGEMSENLDSIKSIMENMVTDQNGN